MAKENSFNGVILHSLFKCKTDNKDTSRFNNTDAFYNFFYTLSNDFNYTNKK